MKNLGWPVQGLHTPKFSIVAERVGLQLILEEWRGVVWGSRSTREGAVSGVSFAVLVVGKLLDDAAAGLGWGKPADRQAQRMQVHVAHSLKVQAVGIHEGTGQMSGREGYGFWMW